MLNPAEIDSGKVARRVSKALKKRAPDTNVDAWVSRLAQALKFSESSVWNWFHGECPPNTQGFWALACHLGPQFVNDCWSDVTGIGSARLDNLGAVQDANELARRKMAFVQIKGIIDDVENNVVNIEDKAS